jgi:type 1 fimbria pilin
MHITRQSEPRVARSIWNPFLSALAGLLVGSLLVTLGNVAFSHFQAQAAPSSANSFNAIVGAWSVEANGAPFVPHVAVFHMDGTMEIDNPESGDKSTSDSVGVGAWRVDAHQATLIIGQFKEINADRGSHQYVNYLIVTFTLQVRGNTFTSTIPAQATYYAPNGVKQAGPYPAMLSGVRIQP